MPAAVADPVIRSAVAPGHAPAPRPIPELDGYPAIGSAPRQPAPMPGPADRPSWTVTAPPVRPDEVYLPRRADGVEVVVRIHGRPLGTDWDRLRFGQEIDVLRRLSTVDHIAEILDSGVLPDGRPFVVSEYCAGGSLAEYVATVGRLTPAERVASVASSLAR